MSLETDSRALRENETFLSRTLFEPSPEAQEETHLRQATLSAIATDMIEVFSDREIRPYMEGTWSQRRDIPQEDNKPAQTVVLILRGEAIDKPREFLVMPAGEKYLHFFTSQNDSYLDRSGNSSEGLKGFHSKVMQFRESNTPTF